MKASILNIFLVILHIAVVNGQSIQMTYTSGNIPTSYLAHDPVCNGANTSLVFPFAVPGDYTVTGIDISFDFTAVDPGWISDGNVREFE